MLRALFIILGVLVFLSGTAQAVEIGLNAENLPELVVYLSDMGVRTVRIMARWQAIEPYETPTEEARAVLLRDNAEALKAMDRRGIMMDPPVIDLDAKGFYWKKYDERIAAAKKSGVDVLFTLRAVSLWGTVQKARFETKGGYMAASFPKDMGRWKDFVAAFVKRYKDSGVRIFYEVENEVNAKAFWAGTPEEYVALLQETYQTIKGIDPSAQVLHAAMDCGLVADGDELTRNRGLSRHDMFLRLIFESRAFDIISTHDYYFSDHEVNGVTFGSYLERIKTMAAEYGLKDCPLWVTETGYVTVSTPVGKRVDLGSLENQAQWLAEAVDEAKSVGVERMFWMLIVDRDEPYFGSMGLFNSDGTTRPVHAVVRWVNKAGLELKEK